MNQKLKNSLTKSQKAYKAFSEILDTFENKGAELGMQIYNEIIAIIKDPKSYEKAMTKEEHKQSIYLVEAMIKHSCMDGVSFECCYSIEEIIRPLFIEEDKSHKSNPLGMLAMTGAFDHVLTKTREQLHNLISVWNKIYSMQDVCEDHLFDLYNDHWHFPERMAKCLVARKDKGIEDEAWKPFIEQLKKVA